MMHGRAIVACSGASSLRLPTTDLFAAYEARTGVTSASGGLVDQWDDIGPNGYNITQATGAAKPTVTTAGGFAAIGFGTSGGTVKRLVNNSVAAISSARTIYVVWSLASTADAYRSLRGTVSAGHGWVGCIRSTTTRYGIYDGGERFVASAIPPGTLVRTTYQVPLTTTLTVTATGGFSETATKGAAAILGITNMQLGGTAGNFYALHADVVAYYEYTAAHNSDVEDYILQEFGV